MTFDKEHGLVFLKGIVGSWEFVAETVGGWIVCNSSIRFTFHIFEMEDPVTTEKVAKFLWPCSSVDRRDLIIIITVAEKRHT